MKAPIEAGRRGARGRGPFFIDPTRRNGTCLLCAIAALGLTGTAFLGHRLREMMPRRDPSIPYKEFDAVTADGVRICARYLPGGDRGAVILAHPAVTGQRYAPLVDLAEMLAEHFDVYTFDFRGHGGSEGRLELDLRGPLEDMRAVLGMVGESSYAWVGAVGFSLGGMTAFLYAALHGGLDAVAVVGAPPLLPDIEPYRRILPAWSLFLRVLGARFKAVRGEGPLPMDAAGYFPDVPLLVVHGACEAFYSREDLDAMLAGLGREPELWVIEGAGHTELRGREPDLVEWLVACSVSAAGER